MNRSNNCNISRITSYNVCYTKLLRIIEGITFREEADEQTGYREKVVIETRDKTKSPAIKILSKTGDSQRSYNIPVGAHISVENGDAIKAGSILVKIPRAVGKAGDITGGLPRVTELFEARVITSYSIHYTKLYDNCCWTFKLGIDTPTCRGSKNACNFSSNSSRYG